MIHSLFVINHSGDVFMEKHWKSVVPRSVCDYFFEVQRQVMKENKGPEDVPSIIATPHHYLVSIYRNNLFFVAVCMTEGEFCFCFFITICVLICVVYFQPLHCLWLSSCIELLTFLNSTSTSAMSQTSKNTMLLFMR